MMRIRKHITEWERWQIYTLLSEGYEQKTIAERLWRPPWTICKEILRNSKDAVYMPVHAQRLYEHRRSEINKGRSKIRDNQKIQHIIRQYMIQEKWAPHAISWRKKVVVSTQTIYNYINERAPSLKQYLKYKKWYKKRWITEKRWKPKENYKLIDERPIEVEMRQRIGDIEVDTIHSAGSERKWGIVTIVDRKTKYLLWGKVQYRTAKEVWDVLITQLKSLPKAKLFTITADNGKEFYDFLRVETELHIPFYFAHPYASYERGTNEQTNSIIRKFYPKWTDFSKISEKEIQHTITMINRMPRKSLNYLCAEEAFHWTTLNL